MKKILAATSSSLAALLIFVPQALATSIDPCINAPADSVLFGACAGKTLGLGQVLGFVIGIAFVLAVLISLFFLVWGGIKWITSGGDKGGVENARNQIIAAIIGLIIVFLAFFILNLVLGFFKLSLFNLQLPTLVP